MERLLLRNKSFYKRALLLTRKGLATQCPIFGGNGVFKARTLLHTFNDSLVYNDDSLCTYTNANMRRMKRPSKSTVAAISEIILKVHPNPANQQVIFELGRALEETATLIIYSGLGAEVKRFQLGKGEKGKVLSVTEYVEGMYYYTLSTANHLIGSGKFVIVH
ncbi:MAG: T9SS type A sorting domain-containing protein [Bacteroidia bacterium]